MEEGLDFADEGGGGAGILEVGVCDYLDEGGADAGVVDEVGFGAVGGGGGQRFGCVLLHLHLLDADGHLGEVFRRDAVVLVECNVAIGCEGAVELCQLVAGGLVPVEVVFAVEG